MSNTGRRHAKLALWVAALAAAGTVIWLALRRPAPPQAGDPVVTDPKATTAPAKTHDAAKPAATPGAGGPKSAEPLTFIAVVRANMPSFPAVQPLDNPLDLPQAAHLVLRDPIYLDSRLNLWITRPEAPPTADVLRKPNPEAEYVVADRVLFVHWAANELDVITPRVVAPRPDGAFDYVTAAGRKRFGGGRDYQWHRARAWDDKILVPTRTGVSVFRFNPAPVETYQDLLDPSRESGGARNPREPGGPAAGASTTNPSNTVKPPEPQLLFDGEGFLAWLPWERGLPGGRGAARFDGTKWVPLGAAAGWPDKILHLIPLLGGSVMQLWVADGDNVKFGVATVGDPSFDRPAVEKLIVQLDAPAQADRDDAFAKLTRYGPAIRPMLKELLPDLPAEAQGRVRKLLSEQVRPLLGPMSTLGDKLRLVSRHADGGAVFFADAGVSVATADGESVEHVPAWLAVRPGQPVRLLPDALTADLSPETAEVIAVDGHEGEWVVVSGAAGDDRGPRRFVGNGLVNLVRKDEAAFTRLVGVDRRGRWLLRKPGGDETLVLDPNLPDVTPHLPVWNYTTAEEVGWDKENWPAVRQAGGLFRLKEGDWEGLEAGERLIAQPDPDLQPGAPLLTAPDGTRYFGGADRPPRRLTRRQGIGLATAGGGRGPRPGTPRPRRRREALPLQPTRPRLAPEADADGRRAVRVGGDVHAQHPAGRSPHPRLARPGRADRHRLREEFGDPVPAGFHPARSG